MGAPPYAGRSGFRTVRPGRGRRLWRYGWPCLVYAGLIAWVSHRPGGTLPALGVGDKSLHALEYAPLGLLTLRWFLRGWAWETRRALPAGWTAAVLYGALDEVHQHFVPGRQADPADLLADALGAALGAAAGVGLVRPGRSRPEAAAGDKEEGRPGPR